MRIAASYHQRFDTGWEAHYEADQGPLTAARVKMAAALVGVLANSLLGVWLYRQFIPVLVGQASRLPSPRRRKRK